MPVDLLLLLLLLCLSLISPPVLNTVTESVANAKIFFDRIDQIGETIVVSVDLHTTWYQRVNSIIVASNWDIAYNT